MLTNLNIHAGIHAYDALDFTIQHKTIVVHLHAQEAGEGSYGKCTVTFYVPTEQCSKTASQLEALASELREVRAEALIGLIGMSAAQDELAPSGTGTT